MASITRSAVDGSSSKRGKGVTAQRMTPSAATRPTVTIAPVPRRWLGGLIDSVLILVVIGMIWSRLSPESVPVQIRIDATTGERVLPAESLWAIDWLSVLSFTVAAVYFIGFLALAGRTPGGWAVGIRCIRADTGDRPGWIVSSRRWLVLLGIPAAVSLLPVIGPWAWLLTVAVIISPLADRSGAGQGIQDRFAGDLVVLDRR
jgi:hypothetical protein